MTTDTVQKSLPLWIACPAASLCPGDAIRVTRDVGLLTGRRMTNGRPEYVTVPTGSGHYPGKPKRKPTTVRLSGRVLDVVDRPATGTRPAGRYVRIEWIGTATACDPRADLPILYHPYEEAAAKLDLPGIDLARAREEGPQDRNRSAGLEWLRERLVKACGDRDPAEALSRCVDPREVRRRRPGGSLEGRHLFTIGSHVAQDVLDGVAPVREWMIRQIDGRVEIPTAHHLDDFDPVQVQDYLYPPGSPAREEVDQVQAIQEAHPTAVIRLVRQRPTDPSEPDEALPTPSPAPSPTIFKVDPSLYAQPDEDDLIYE
ncbi:hypothetical protein [Aureimonas ureilytica]|uniref:hypothetical protein n=1 Tax=Aureimonas ureilytica TaxID=401562 RepID=UPI000B2BFE5D|nr:hypothetical protein [Aureimonas ureilytica]